MTTAVVAGGGIGGLAAALALARAGVHVVVLEREAGFSELGAGIQLAPNAWRALDRLGVGVSALPHTVGVDQLEVVHAADGRILVALATGDAFRKRFGHRYAVAHRGHLHRALLDRCRGAGVELVPGMRVTGYESLPDGVVVHVADGRWCEADLLVGADGLRSAVRAKVVGDGGPTPAGHTAYRTVLPSDPPAALQPPVKVTLWSAPDWHAVRYPIDGGRYTNLVVTVVDGAGERRPGESVPVAEVLGVVRGAQPAALVDDLRKADDWRAWSLFDRPPTGRWVDGRTCLLGDAAHPMLQYAAQGAAMALEDAVTLGEEVGRACDVRTALTSYARLRRDRTAKVQRASRWVGDEIYHPRRAQANRRDALLTHMSADDLAQSLTWLYAHDTLATT